MPAARIVPVFMLPIFMMAALSAQIQFPGSGSGIPFPGSGGRNRGGNNGGRGGGKGDDQAGGKTQGRDKQGGSKQGGSKKDAPPVVTTTGILRFVAGNQFVMEADDHRIITYSLGPKAEILKDAKPAALTAFGIADHLSVDAFADEMGFFTATGVTFNSAGSEADKEHAARIWDLPALASAAKTPAARNSASDEPDGRPTLRRKTPEPESQAAEVIPENIPETNRPATELRPADAVRDADDPGRPQIRRGIPAARAPARGSSEVEESAAPQPATPARRAEPDAAGVVPIQEDPILVKARQAAAEYAGMLPDFFCRQVTTRFESDVPKDGWQARDTITADLTVEHGVESYKNIRVGNQSPKDSMEEVGGNWSTGEFSSLVDGLFNPATHTSFRRLGTETLQGRTTYSFKFDVTRENARWRISVGGQLYYPAYRGTIWVDRETSRVLRIESESRNVPPLFALTKVEEAVDYGFVRLSTPQAFLLPTQAEVLSCEQGSTRCVRNKIEFRNYRKFGAESEIKFDEKQ